MRYRIAFLIIIMLSVFTACNLAGEPPTQRPSSVTPQSQGGVPQVTIVSVAPGQNVAVNQTVTVTAAVTDTVGVTRVNLVANGQVADNFSSASSSGETNRTIQLDFTPRTVGVVTLDVVASRLDGTQSQAASVQITVGASATNTPLPGAGGTSGGGGVTVNPCLNVTASQCSACISGAAGANLRTIPDSTTANTVIRVLPSGTITPIIGRTSNSQWWQVRDGNSNAWLSDTVIDTLGVCTGVPVVANAGVPTATVVVIPSSTPVILTATPLNLPSATPAMPDLVVASVSGEHNLTLSGGSVTSTYTVVISNTGFGTSGAFSNTLTVLPSNTVINLGSVSSLARSESITLPATLTFTSAGTYTLSVRADSGSNVTETFEQNNTDNSFLVTVSN